MQIRQLTSANQTLFTLTQTFRYLNCCCNFFLYSATSSLFRRELREIFQCFNSTTNNQKHLNTRQTGSLTRTRAQSSPPAVCATNIDPAAAAERKKLLAIRKKSVDINVGENFNLSSTATDPTNGHAVSFNTWTIIAFARHFPFSCPKMIISWYSVCLFIQQMFETCSRENS